MDKFFQESGSIRWGCCIIILPKGLLLYLNCGAKIFITKDLFKNILQECLKHLVYLYFQILRLSTLDQMIIGLGRCLPLSVNHTIGKIKQIPFVDACRLKIYLHWGKFFIFFSIWKCTKMVLMSVSKGEALFSFTKALFLTPVKFAVNISILCQKGRTGTYLHPSEFNGRMTENNNLFDTNAKRLGNS